MKPKNPCTYSTELGEQLGRDEHGTVRAALRARLITLQASLQSELRRPQPPERYRQLQAASRATDAALDVLRSVLVPRPDGSLAGPVSNLAPRRA